MMDLLTTLEPKDAIASGIALGALLISVVSLLYMRSQIRRAQISERGVLFKELYQKFFDDEEIRYVYNLTEDEERIFSRKYGASEPEEILRRQKAIEQLFAHLEVICALHKSKLLAPDDMEHFRYINPANK